MQTEHSNGKVLPAEAVKQQVAEPEIVEVVLSSSVPAAPKAESEDEEVALSSSVPAAPKAESEDEEVALSSSVPAAPKAESEDEEVALSSSVPAAPKAESEDEEVALSSSVPAAPKAESEDEEVALSSSVPAAPKAESEDEEVALSSSVPAAPKAESEDEEVALSSSVPAAPKAESEDEEVALSSSVPAAPKAESEDEEVALSSSVPAAPKAESEDEEVALSSSVPAAPKAESEDEEVALSSSVPAAPKAESEDEEVALSSSVPAAPKAESEDEEVALSSSVPAAPKAESEDEEVALSSSVPAAPKAESEDEEVALSSSVPAAPKAESEDEEVALSSSVPAAPKAESEDEEVALSSSVPAAPKAESEDEEVALSSSVPAAPKAESEDEEVALSSSVPAAPKAESEDEEVALSSSVPAAPKAESEDEEVALSSSVPAAPKAESEDEEVALSSSVPAAPKAESEDEEVVLSSSVPVAPKAESEDEEVVLSSSVPVAPKAESEDEEVVLSSSVPAAPKAESEDEEVVLSSSVPAAPKAESEDEEVVLSSSVPAAPKAESEDEEVVLSSSVPNQKENGLFSRWSSMFSKKPEVQSTVQPISNKKLTKKVANMQSHPAPVPEVEEVVVTAFAPKLAHPVPNSQENGLLARWSSMFSKKPAAQNTLGSDEKLPAQAVKINVAPEQQDVVSVASVAKPNKKANRRLLPRISSKLEKTVQKSESTVVHVAPVVKELAPKSATSVKVSSNSDEVLSGSKVEKTEQRSEPTVVEVAPEVTEVAPVPATSDKVVSKNEPGLLSGIIAKLKPQQNEAGSKSPDRSDEELKIDHVDLGDPTPAQLIATKSKQSKEPSKNLKPEDIMLAMHTRFVVWQLGEGSRVDQLGHFAHMVSVLSAVEQADKSTLVDKLKAVELPKNLVVNMNHQYFVLLKQLKDLTSEELGASLAAYISFVESKRESIGIVQNEGKRTLTDKERRHLEVFTAIGLNSPKNGAKGDSIQLSPRADIFGQEEQEIAVSDQPEIKFDSKVVKKKENRNSSILEFFSWPPKQTKAIGEKSGGKPTSSVEEQLTRSDEKLGFSKVMSEEVEENPTPAQLMAIRSKQSTKEPFKLQPEQLIKAMHKRFVIRQLGEGRREDQLKYFARIVNALKDFEETDECSLADKLKAVELPKNLVVKKNQLYFKLLEQLQALSSEQLKTSLDAYLTYRTTIDEGIVKTQEENHPLTDKQQRDLEVFRAIDNPEVIVTDDIASKIARFLS